VRYGFCLGDILDCRVAVRSIRHTKSDLLIEYVIENSVYLRVPIDRPVHFLGKIMILLVTTFEYVVPNGICREELGNFVGGEAWDYPISMRLL